MEVLENAQVDRMKQSHGNTQTTHGLGALQEPIQNTFTNFIKAEGLSVNYSQGQEDSDESGLHPTLQDFACQRCMQARGSSCGKEHGKILTSFPQINAFSNQICLQ